MKLRKKIRKIRKNDYESYKLHTGQEWYLANGEYLSLEESRKCLLEMMRHMKRISESILSLRNTIDISIEEYEVSGNLFDDVLELGEALSAIQIECINYLDEFSKLDLIPMRYSRDNRYYFDMRELPF